jgi:hypothetical protein
MWEMFTPASIPIYVSLCINARGTDRIVSRSYLAVLRIQIRNRIRKDPKLLAGFGSDSDTIRIRNKHFGSETRSETGSETNL